MDKIILTKEQVHDLIDENKYPVTEKNQFLSRCIDGRYSNKKDLPPLAFPGADAGDLALIFATANSFGLTVNPQKALDVFIKVIGGIENFQFHSDHHGDRHIPASGCGHMKQMNLDPAAYFMEKEQLAFIADSLNNLKKKGAIETLLEGDHAEGALLQITGNYSVYPHFTVDTGEGTIATEVFVYQTTLVNKRHSDLAKKLIENKAIELFPGTDIEYLYQAFAEMSDNHLFETAKRLAKGLPIYMVKFNDDATFKIEEIDKVI